MHDGGVYMGRHRPPQNMSKQFIPLGLGIQVSQKEQRDYGFTIALSLSFDIYHSAIPAGT